MLGKRKLQIKIKNSSSKSDCKFLQVRSNKTRTTPSLAVHSNGLHFHYAGMTDEESKLRWFSTNILGREASRVYRLSNTTIVSEGNPVSSTKMKR